MNEDSASRVSLSLRYRVGASKEPTYSVSAPESGDVRGHDDDRLGTADLWLDPYGSLWEAVGESREEFERFFFDFADFLRESGIEQWGEDQLTPENLALTAKDLWEYSQSTGNPLYSGGLASAKVLAEMAYMFYDQFLPWLAEWMVDQEQRRRQRKREKEKQKEKNEQQATGGGSYGGSSPGSPTSPGPPPPPPPPREEDDDDDDDDWPNAEKLLESAEQVEGRLHVLEGELRQLLDELDGLEAPGEAEEEARRLLAELEAQRRRLGEGAGPVTAYGGGVG